MKKTIIASLAVLATAAVLITFALGGAGKFENVQVNANPTEYSITFNESNTTVETVDEHYAFGTTTASGNKVGVVGWYNMEACFTFNDVSFASLMLHHYEIFTEDRDVAQPFSTITGFAISFSGEEKEEPEPVDVAFRYGEETIYHVESEHEYRGLSITPRDNAEFIAGGDVVIVSSLTIYYSCSQ